MTDDEFETIPCPDDHPGCLVLHKRRKAAAVVDAKNYPALVTVKAVGFSRGHTVEINGQRAYYRPYDGSGHEAVANEAYATLGELLRERLDYPLTSLAEDADPT